jgi:hypothetical protein
MAMISNIHEKGYNWRVISCLSAKCNQYTILSYGAMAARRTVNAMVRGSSPRRTARWRCTKSERTSKVSGVTHDYVRSVN